MIKLRIPLTTSLLLIFSLSILLTRVAYSDWRLSRVDQSLNPVYEKIAHHFRSLGYSSPESLTIISSRVANAFTRDAREVVITDSLITTVTDPSELAFILAHELSHLALSHKATTSVSAEVEADSLALKVVTELGFNPCSGSHILKRLGAPQAPSLVSITPRLQALDEQTTDTCG